MKNLSGFCKASSSLTVYLAFMLVVSLSVNLTISRTVNAETFEEEVLIQHFSEAELAQMLAPIALYPDSLLTHILIASTYPLEVIEAQRWIEKNNDLTTQNLAYALEDKTWDPSVIALVAFPKLLAQLSEDLHWMRQLGDAFLQDEELVLQSIQVLRNQAEQAGSLAQMDNVEIAREDNNIIIQPIEKEYIYVPYYNPSVVYGAWHWTNYPPVHWVNYYPVYPVHHGLFSWHSGVHISVNFFFSAFHWHNHHIVVVNHHNSHYYRPRKHIVTGHHGKRWHHKPQHRKGVAYLNNETKKRYSSNRTSVKQNQKVREKEKKMLAYQKKEDRVKYSNYRVKPDNQSLNTNQYGLAKKQQKLVTRHKDFSNKIAQKKRKDIYPITQESNERFVKYSPSKQSLAYKKSQKQKQNYAVDNEHQKLAYPTKQGINPVTKNQPVAKVMPEANHRPEVKNRPEVQKESVKLKYNNQVKRKNNNIQSQSSKTRRKSQAVKVNKSHNNNASKNKASKNHSVKSKSRNKEH